MLKRKELTAVAIVGMLVVSASYSAGAITSIQYAKAQQQPPSSTSAGNATSAAGGGGGGLKFFIKLNQNASSSQQQPQAGGGGNASGGGGAASTTKKVTINVHVQQGPNGKPATLPITAIVPQNTKPQDMQLCAQIGSNQPVCQPLMSAVAGGCKTTLDLTNQTSG